MTPPTSKASYLPRSEPRAQGREPPRRHPPLRRTDLRDRAALEHLGRVDGALAARRGLRVDGRRDHGRLPPSVHTPGLPDETVGALDVRDPRLDGGRGPGARVG